MFLLLQTAKKKKKKRHTFLPQAIILPQIELFRRDRGHRRHASLRCEKHSDVDIKKGYYSFCKAFLFTNVHDSAGPAVLTDMLNQLESRKIKFLETH